VNVLGIHLGRRNSASFVFASSWVGSQPIRFVSVVRRCRESRIENERELNEMLRCEEIPGRDTRGGSL